MTLCPAFTIALAAAFVAPLAGQNQRESTLTTQQKRLNGESFEMIWSTIHDQYWDPQFVGVNQINVGIPAGTPTGDKVSLQIQVGGVTTDASPLYPEPLRAVFGAVPRL